MKRTGVLLIFLLIFTGLVDFLSLGQGFSTIQLQINWKTLAKIAKDKKVEAEITWIGIRLVCPQKYYAVTFGTNRFVVGEEGAFVLPALAGEYVNLFIVAASKEDPARYREALGGDYDLFARLLGSYKNLYIPVNQAKILKLEDFEWVVAAWQEDSGKLTGPGVTIEAGSGQTAIKLFLKVTDPFQVGETPLSWAAKLVRCMGFNIGTGPNPNGWRTFTVEVYKDVELVKGKKNQGFVQPYINGVLFGLPSELIIPPVVGWFYVQWK